MKYNVLVPLLTGLLTVTLVAQADEHPVRIGAIADLGVPSGLALGVVVHPKADWLTGSVALTHNSLNFGGRLSVKFDPIAYIFPKLFIGGFLDLQGGFAADGTVPGYSEYPSINYQYINVYAGFRLGKPNKFHWNFEVGPSYIHIASGSFQSMLGKYQSAGTTFGNPSIQGWFLPTFVTGPEILFHDF